MSRDPFDALADTADHAVTPDPGFAARLRRRIEHALLDDALPTVGLPDRATTSPATATPRPDHEPDEQDATMPAAPPPTTSTQIITPYISVHDGAAALAWYCDAFGADETVRYVGDDGRLGHAEFIVAGARVMLSDAYPEIGVVAATSYEGSSCALHIEVDDCDGLHDRAVEHGATSAMPPTDQPHGARTATIVDPFGHRWMLSQQLSSPTTAEIDAAYDGYTVTEAE